MIITCHSGQSESRKLWCHKGMLGIFKGTFSAHADNARFNVLKFDCCGSHDGNFT